MFFYHVVTERPMQKGQHIIFDENNRSGVYRRVMDKRSIVEDIYRNPEKYEGVELDHNTLVALRELAMEKVRQEKYPQYPSRMAALYVSKTYEEAERWGEFFARIGRPTYSIVKVEVDGNIFEGDACNCFDGTLSEEENLRMAESYWRVDPNDEEGAPVIEVLVGGDILVAEIVKEINANL